MHNPIKFFETKFNELENNFNSWLAKQSLPVEVAVVTLIGAAHGAASGGFMATFTKKQTSVSPAAQPPDASLNSQSVDSFPPSQAPVGGPLIQARNLAVMTGVNAFISSVMKRLRGKEDVQTSMVAGFGSGVMFSLVSGSAGPNRAANVITSGVFFALFQGMIFKVGEKFSGPHKPPLLILDHGERDSEMKKDGWRI